VLPAAAVRLLRTAWEGLTWHVLWPDFASAWSQARRDAYARHGPKTRRRWPSKKRQTPPRPPEQRSFDDHEPRNLLDLGYLLIRTG
jgi:hypothetical protein